MTARLSKDAWYIRSHACAPCGGGVALRCVEAGPPLLMRLVRRTMAARTAAAGTAKPAHIRKAITSKRPNPRESSCKHVCPLRRAPAVRAHAGLASTPVSGLSCLGLPRL